MSLLLVILLTILPVNNFLGFYLSFNCFIVTISRLSLLLFILLGISFSSYYIFDFFSSPWIKYMVTAL